MNKIKCLGLIMNVYKKQPLILARKIIAWLEEKGVKVYLPSEESAALGQIVELSNDEIRTKIDCLLVLGGDGTLLRAARFSAGYNTPILGINLGRIGFLTEIEVNETEYYLEQLIQGSYSLEKRSMLHAKIKRNKQVIHECFGLNDIVINKGCFTRLITLKVFLDKEYVATYTGDGIIVCTPTGSTAYSLSAGGPLVYPKLNVNIITPISPHSLYCRPMVIPSESIINIRVETEVTDAILSADGQGSFNLSNGDEVLVTQSKYFTNLIKFKEKSFFEILREKLNINGGNNYE